MVTKTFMANNLFNELTMFHSEAPLTAIPSFGQDLTPRLAAWVLWNEPTSGQKISVKNLKVTYLMSQGTTTGLSKLDIQTITGYTENEVMTGTAAIVVKLDSDNAELPSQVKCLTRLESVTGGTTTRSSMNIMTMNMTRALGCLVRRYGATANAMNYSTIQSCGYGNSDIQTWTLRESEGLAIVPNDIQVNNTFRFSIYFKIGTHCYMMSETLRPFALMPPMMLFNGSGSGVVLNVFNVEMQELGTDDLCNFAVQKIDGCLTELYSTDVTSSVFSMDRTQSLPTGIKMYEDCAVSIEGGKIGAIIANPSYRRNIQQWYGVGPELSGLRLAGIVASSELIDVGPSPIILHPGEGLALFMKNSSGRGRYGGSILFNIEPEVQTTHAIASVC